MARKRRSKSRTRRRRTSSARSLVGAVRRRRRSHGGFGRGKFGVAMPTLEAAYLAVAAIAGEVILLLLAKFGINLPDWIPEHGLGIWLWGWWKKDARLQQFGYSLIVVELLDGSGVVDKVKEMVGVGTVPADSGASTNDQTQGALGPADLGNVIDFFGQQQTA